MPATGYPRSSMIEKRLDQLIPGEWTYDQAVPLGYIDGEASLRRRIGGPREPDEEEVARFRADMESGATFPAILCLGTPHPGGLIVFDGLRIYLAAQQLGRASIAAYLAPEAALDRLAF